MATGETGIQTIVLHELTSWVVWKQLKNYTFMCDISVLLVNCDGTKHIQSGDTLIT